MQVVASNLRLGYLEIDIVAREHDTIAVVEVRTRGAGAWTTGFGSIDHRKRTRIRRAGERLWRRFCRHDRSIQRLRFDAASVKFGAGPPDVEYVRAAF
jgi:putative endonuclease